MSGLKENLSLYSNVSKRFLKIYYYSSFPKLIVFSQTKLLKFSKVGLFKTFNF